MAKSSLEPAALKIDRARHHMYALHGAFKSWFERKPYSIIAERDGDWWVFRFAVLREPDPRWAVVVGEVFHNLRSALDLTFAALAELQGQRNARRVGFPIALNRFEYATFAAKYMSKFTPAQRALIQRLQPYRRWDGANAHPLNVVRRYSNADKHRFLPPVIAWIGRPEANRGIELTWAGRIADERLTLAQGQRMKDRTEFYRVLLDPPDSYVKMETNLPIDIAFGKGAAPLPPDHIDKLVVYVDGVRELFEPFFNRG